MKLMDIFDNDKKVRFYDFNKNWNSSQNDGRMSGISPFTFSAFQSAMTKQFSFTHIFHPHKQWLHVLRMPRSDQNVDWKEK